MEQMELEMTREAVIAAWDAFVDGEMERLTASEFYEGIKDSFRDLADTARGIVVTAIDEYELAQRGNDDLTIANAERRVRYAFTSHRKLVVANTDYALRQNIRK